MIQTDDSVGNLYAGEVLPQSAERLPLHSRMG